MYDDSELIGIKPCGDGMWEVNGVFPLTLEEALDYAAREMREWKPEPEVVTVMTEEQMRFHQLLDAMNRRMMPKILKCFKSNPYSDLMVDDNGNAVFRHDGP